MQTSTPGDHNELEQNLLSSPSHPVNEHLRQVVYIETVRLLRGRRRRRRIAFVALFALCYAAGLATVALLRTGQKAPRAEVSVAETTVHGDRPHEAAPPSAPDQPAPLVPDFEAAVPALVLEKIGASFRGERRVAYFRAAGDRYLEIEDDLSSAVRCYKQALDAASRTEAEISSADSWLLMAMKKARKGEPTHANSSS
jgi:hypothetical protein